jgi:hypothetical protein
MEQQQNNSADMLAEIYIDIYDTTLEPYEKSDIYGKVDDLHKYMTKEIRESCDNIEQILTSKIKEIKEKCNKLDIDRQRVPILMENILKNRRLKCKKV